MKMMKNEAFPSRFWKAADIPARGLALKIAKLQLEKVGPDQKEKYALYFKGHDKQFILNPTNWDLIAEFCGADSDLWPGKDIILFPDKTPFGGKLVDCIRVRQPQRVQAQRPQAFRSAQRPQPVQDFPPDEDGDPGFSAEDAADFEV
jgi:hypothetical protein